MPLMWYETWCDEPFGGTVPLSIDLANTKNMKKMKRKVFKQLFWCQQMCSITTEKKIYKIAKKGKKKKSLDFRLLAYHRHHRNNIKVKSKSFSFLFFVPTSSSSVSSTFLCVFSFSVFQHIVVLCHCNGSTKWNMVLVSQSFFLSKSK